MQDTNRRPIAARHSGWAARTATLLARSAITPNQISCISVVFALAGAGALLYWPGPLGQLLCAAGILLRLLCNLFDGMVAIEGGKSTPTGALYNEMPDRIADSLFIVALGYACGQPWLGWCGALLAALTAYVRLMGGTLLSSQDFRGPMAKPQRMWLMGAALIAASILSPWQQPILLGTAAIIALGSALTCITRTRAIAAALHGAAT